MTITKESIVHFGLRNIFYVDRVYFGLVNILILFAGNKFFKGKNRSLNPVVDLLRELIYYKPPIVYN